MHVNCKLDICWYCTTICYADVSAYCCLKEAVLLPLLCHSQYMIIYTHCLFWLLIPICQLDQLFDLMEKLAHLENECCVWFVLGFFSRLTNLSLTPCILIITRADTKKVTVCCWIHKTGVGVVWKHIFNRCLLWNRIFSFFISWILPQLTRWKYEPTSYLIKKSY